MVYLRGFEKVILDAGSFSLTLLLIFSFFFYKKNLIESNKINILLFCIIFFTIQPFFFNSVLIDPYKIYDQFKYIGELDFSDDFKNNNLKYRFFNQENQFRLDKVLISNFFYKTLFFFPTGSINSVAFINKFLFLTALSFLFINKKIDFFSFIIILFIPSLIFYSSVSLKEILIVFFSIICIYSIFEKKYILFIILTVLLYLIREQFALILFSFLVIGELLINKKINFSVFKIFISILLFLLFFFSNEILNYIIHIKSIYILEVNSYKKIYNIDKFYISNFYDLFFSIFDDIFKKFLLINKISNFYKLFFLIENFVIIFFIIKAFKNPNYALNVNIFFLFFLIFNYCTIYYLVENIFTAHRYFFPFFISYIIITSYKRKK